MKLSMFMLPLRALQLIFAFTVMGLSGYVAHWYNTDNQAPTPGQIGFLIFSSLFSIISVVVLEAFPRFVPKLALPIPFMALELLNVLFYFAGFIALAVFLNTLLFCRGAVCSSAQADTGIAALLWLLWAGSAVINGFELVRKGGFRGGMRFSRTANVMNGSGGADGGAAPPQAGSGPYPRGMDMKEMKDAEA